MAGPDGPERPEDKAGRGAPGDAALAAVLAGGPDEVAVRLITEPPTGLDWRAVAEIAGSRALPPGDGPLADALEDALAWARVARIASEHLAAAADVAGDAIARDDAERAMLRLRGDLIMRHGERPGDPLLDADGIFDWFLRTHDGTFDAVARDAVRWRDLPRDRLRELRSVKNALAIVDRLAVCPRYGADPEIRRWRSIRDALP
jgi:hypothetical protein